LEKQYLKKVIECIIFVSEKPLSIQRLLKVLPEAKKSEITECIEELISEWNSLDRGFRLHEVANSYQFRTNSDFSNEIIRFKAIKPFRLSRAALEALAIIAYNQPITRLEVDQIRGVDSTGVIALLLEKRLIEISGRKEVIGRPFLYQTTNEFLETFGLKNMRDLPSLKELEEIEVSFEKPLQGRDV
jgi:segregation and condensation protein B